MKYGVIGTGAVGGYYGCKLAKSGIDIHFLLHSDYNYVLEHGFQVDSCDGSFHLDKINIYNDVLSMPKCDVVLICLKSVNNKLLEQFIPSIIKDDSLVILIQNGIGLEYDVQQMFPRLSLAAGLAFICSAKTQPGRINHQCYGSINIGNYSCGDKQRLNQVIMDFRNAGIDANEVEYNEARWKKAVWNMPFNGLTVVLNTQTNLLLQNPFTQKLVKDIMLEVVNAAKALGVNNIDETFADKMIDTTIKMTPYSPSMKLDFDYKRPMEIYYLYTRPIAEAAKAGVKMKKLEMLEAELLYLSRNTAT